MLPGGGQGALVLQGVVLSEHPDIEVVVSARRSRDGRWLGVIDGLGGVWMFARGDPPRLLWRWRPRRSRRWKSGFPVIAARIRFPDPCVLSVRRDAVVICATPGENWVCRRARTVGPQGAGPVRTLSRPRSGRSALWPDATRDPELAAIVGRRARTVVGWFAEKERWEPGRQSGLGGAPGGVAAEHAQGYWVVRHVSAEGLWWAGVGGELYSLLAPNGRLLRMAGSGRLRCLDGDLTLHAAQAAGADQRDRLWVGSGGEWRSVDCPLGPLWSIRVHSGRGLIAVNPAIGSRVWALLDPDGRELYRSEPDAPRGLRAPTGFSPDGTTLVLATAAYLDVMDISNPSAPVLTHRLRFQDQQLVSVGARGRLAISRSGSEGVTLVDLASERNVWLPTRGLAPSALKLLDDRLLVGCVTGEAWEVPLTGPLAWARVEV